MSNSVPNTGNRKCYICGEVPKSFPASRAKRHDWIDQRCVNKRRKKWRQKRRDKRAQSQAE